MAQLKDLLVLGASRFLNIIHGSIDGNAASSDKVNHSLKISIPASSKNYVFTGESDCSLTLNASSFGLNGSMRLVGEVPADCFGIDEFDNRWCLLTTSSGFSAIPITTVYNSELVTTDSVTNNGTTYTTTCYPQLGYVIRTGDLELVCVGIDQSGVQDTSGTTYAKNSKWVILGNNEVWHTF